MTSWPATTRSWWRAARTVARTLKPNAPNRPIENVQGHIRQVGSNGLVLISLGSDAGPCQGQHVEVYRLNTQTPELSKYLGRIKITEVTAKGAWPSRLAERRDRFKSAIK